MGYTTDVPKYVIDLKKPEWTRWNEVIKKDTGVVWDLIEQAKEDLCLPSVLSGCALWLAGSAYRMAGGIYDAEFEAWAEKVGISSNTFIGLNCVYELSHIDPSAIFGCTAGVRWVEGQGMVHVRNMDWPLSEIGNATRVFEFAQGNRKFYSVGIAGHIGVFSGMLPGKYSVTINWATPDDSPSLNYSPSFLLRDVLTHCDSYDECIKYLSKTAVSSAVFFTVCGTEKGQACVVERTSDQSAVREIGRSDSVVQANHFLSAKFKHLNEDMDYVEEDDEMSALEFSQDRHRSMRESITAFKSLKSITKAINRYPVLNEDSYQKI